jgi:hypothetical protein
VEEQTPLTVFSKDALARTGYLTHSCRASLQYLLDEGDLSQMKFTDAQDLVDLALQIRRAVAEFEREREDARS